MAIAIAGYCYWPRRNILVIIMARAGGVARRALEALANHDIDSDYDSDASTNHLIAEERRVRNMLRYAESRRSDASSRMGSVPSSQHCNENSTGESFLEGMARREYEVQKQSRPSRANNENDYLTLTRVHQCHRLFTKLNLEVEANFSGGDRDESDSDSSGFSSSEDGGGDGHDSDSDSSGGSRRGDDDDDAFIPNAHVAGVMDPIAIAALNALADIDDDDEDREAGDEENGDDEAYRSIRNNDETTLGSNDITSVLQLLPPPSSIKFDSNNSEIRGTNNFQRLSNLLVSLANSEENPLIRADIPWPVIIACGSPFMATSPFLGVAPSPLSPPKPSLLQTLYHQSDDPHGTRLLKGVLRSKHTIDLSFLFSFIELTHNTLLRLFQLFSSGPSFRGCPSIARRFSSFMPRHGSILHCLPVRAPSHITKFESFPCA